MPEQDRAAHRYRVGSHYGIHVYDGNRPVATFHDAAEAALFVGLAEALAASEAKVARVEALALAIRTGHASGNSGAIYAALADDPASRT